MPAKSHLPLGKEGSRVMHVQVHFSRDRKVTLWNSLCQGMIRAGGIQKGTGQMTNPKRASRKAGPQWNIGCCKAHRVPMVAALRPVWWELIKATSEGLKHLPSHCLLLRDERRCLVVHLLTPQPPGKFIQRSFCHFSLANKSAPLLSPKPSSLNPPLPTLRADLQAEMLEEDGETASLLSACYMKSRRGAGNQNCLCDE